MWHATKVIFEGEVMVSSNTKRPKHKSFGDINDLFAQVGKGNDAHVTVRPLPRTGRKPHQVRKNAEWDGQFDDVSRLRWRDETATC